ncbi:MAG TPA: hypothetical protein VF950_19015 [Planctomycetota bacterium]
MTKILAVPLSSFVLALALSYLTQGPSRGFALRPAQAVTGAGCVLTIENLWARVDIFHWTRENEMFALTGTYDGKLNTTLRNMKEGVYIKMHLHLIELEQAGEPPGDLQKFNGHAFGLLKEDKKVRDDGGGPDTVPYEDAIKLDPNDQADLDQAIKSAKAALEAALIQSGKEVGPTEVDKKEDLIKSIGKGFDLKLIVTADGKTVEGVECFARGTLVAKINLDEEGNQINVVLEPEKKDDPKK